MLTGQQPSPHATPHFCALRGAPSVATDDPRLITDAVNELLTELLQANELTADAIVSAIFSATHVLLHLSVAADHSLHPVYLRDARRLRPDLVQS
jgi:chorismate mutase